MRDRGGQFLDKEPYREETEKGRRWQKLLALLLLLTLIGMVIVFGVYRIRKRLKPTEVAVRPPLPVETMRVEPRPFYISRSYTGTIISIRRALISARVTARIKRLHYQEGESVEAGALLITLDDRELRAEVGRLEANGKRILADLNYWKLQAMRDEKLLKARAISRKKSEESKRMVASLEASFRANEYALIAARTRLGYTLIKAPFSGVLQHINTEVGELAMPGKTLIELVAPDPLKAVVSVPEKDLPKIHEGMDVQLFVTSLGKAIKASIDHVYPILDLTTRNGTFEVYIPKGIRGLRSGMTVEVRVSLKHFEKAIVLPLSSIRILEDKNGVYILNENVAKWRPVTLGESNGRAVRILEGIKKGELVITTPDPRLKDGIEVQPKNDWRHAS